MRVPTEEEKKLYDEYHQFRKPALYQELVKRNTGNIKVLALDLEWTLVESVAVGVAFALKEEVKPYVTPRVGLFKFLEAVQDLFEKVVVFTAVRSELFEKTIEALALQNDAPKWFKDIECVQWPRTGYKDLAYITGIEPHQALIVDDYRRYIKPSQLFQWIEIPGYRYFGSNYNDYELNKVLAILEMIQLGKIRAERILEILKAEVNHVGSGIKKCWLCGPFKNGQAEHNSKIKIVIKIDEKENARRLNETPRRGVQKGFSSTLKWRLWAEFDLVSYSDLDTSAREKIKNKGILVVNEWERFNVVFTRIQGGMDVNFPELPGCTGFCPHDGSEAFDKFLFPVCEQTGEILKTWLKTADRKDVPIKRHSKEELRGLYPDAQVSEMSCRLPWRKQ